MAVQSIQIIFDEASGGIQVNAPPNLVMAFGMLEMAKVALLKRAEKPQQSVVPVGAAALSNGAMPKPPIKA